MRAERTNKNHNVDELQHRHMQAIERGDDWLQLWMIFHDDNWFQACLEKSIGQALRAFNVNFCHYREDVSQEALLLFSRSLQLNPNLGFDPQKGSYQALIKTIVYRSCVKAVERLNRQFHNEYSGLESAMMVAEKPTRSTDLLELIEKLPGEVRIIAQLHCLGKTVDEIVELTRLSRRTVYRHLNKAIERLKSMMELE